MTLWRFILAEPLVAEKRQGQWRWHRPACSIISQPMIGAEHHWMDDGYVYLTDDPYVFGDVRCSECFGLDEYGSDTLGPFTSTEVTWSREDHNRWDAELEEAKMWDAEQ